MSGRDRRVHEVFDRVVDLDPERRRRALERLCAGDPSLKAEVEDLLDRATMGGTGDLLPALSGSGPGLEGRRIGPYRVLSRIGAGGMGVVYLVERPDVGKRAALKILRYGGLAGEREIDRFLRERSILAGLEHPAIAALLDAGSSDDGLPYFVMEYVEGEALDEFCDAREIDVAGRVRLVCEVLAAVHAAHEAGVVHRDLKPSNILITDAGQVRLVDFGVARRTSADDTVGDETSAGGLTLTGSLLGTPEYASPEQVRGEPAGPASDVYSVGVVLYELLTGRRPYALPERHSALAVERAILDAEPVIPSRAAAEPGGSASGLAGRRRAAWRLAGDLDIIVLKSLEKSPERRYTSAAAMRDDLARFLGERPILARSPSVAYRARKLVRRRRREVAGLAAISLVAVAATGWITLLSETPAPPSAARDVVTTALLDAAAGVDCWGRPGGPAIQRGTVTARRTAGEVVLGISLAAGVPEESYTLHLGARSEGRGPCPPRETGMRLASDAAGFAQASLSLPIERFDSMRPGDGFGSDTISVLLVRDGGGHSQPAYAALVPMPALPVPLTADQQRLAADAFITRHGEMREAQQLLRARVTETPEDPEAWDAYADWLYHYGPYFGRSGRAARAEFERALALDPDHPNALVHLVYIAANEGRAREVDSLVAKIESRRLVEGGTLKQMRLLRVALVGSDSVRRAHVEAFADSGYVDAGNQLDLSVDLPTDDTAWRFLDILLNPARPAPVRASAYLSASVLELARGRLEASERHLDAAARVVPLQALERRALHAVQPFIPVDTTRLVALRDSLASWSGLRLFVPMHAPYGPINERDSVATRAVGLYLIGRIEARLGRPDGVRHAMGALERLTDVALHAPVVRSLIDDLAARILRDEGQTERALERALATRPGTLRGITYREHLESQHRLLIAELLAESGRAREAVGWFDALSDAWPWDTFYRAPIDLWIGDLHESLGEPGLARARYARFIERWRDCDSALEPLRESARRALERLDANEAPARGG